MTDPMLAEEYISACARPRFATAPPGALVPAGGGPLWRNSHNLIAYDGCLRRRAGVVAVSNGLAPATYSMLSTVESEVPLHILTGYIPSSAAPTSSTNAPCGDIYTPATSAAFLAVVTSRQIWIYNSAAGGWVNGTPTYTTGTITATNGSATITGAGTAWLTRGLSPYQFILIDGAWYQICSIASDTSATLTSNFTGVTGAGKAYTWKRTWNLARTGGLDEPCCVSATINNQNLYVGGRFIARADGQQAPALIRVANCFSATPVPSYLTASVDLTGTVDEIAGLTDITGVKVLQDGRVIFSGNGAAGPATIFWSSPTDQTIWTASPAGSQALVYFEGAIMALGRVGDLVTVHHECGVVLGRPTNQSEPPLSFAPSGATQGCYAPRTLRTIGGAEYYVTSSANVARFDLASSTNIGDDTRVALGLDFTTKAALRLCFAGYLPGRQEYMVFSLNPSLGAFSTLSLRDGTWWPGRIRGPVTAIGDGDPLAANTGAGLCLLGVQSYNSSSVERNLLWTLAERVAGDALADPPGTETGGAYAETDDLDFGAPLTYKTLSVVQVWFRLHPQFSGSGSYSATVSASIDGGNSWVSVDRTVTCLSTGETPVQFSFLGNIAASHQLRIRVGADSTGTATAWNLFPTRMRIVVQMGGSLEQVEL